MWHTGAYGGGVFMNEVSGRRERDLAPGWTLLCTVGVSFTGFRGRTKDGCGLRHGSYKFRLIYSIRNAVVVYTSSGCTATHYVMCSVVCTDLPLGSHESCPTSTVPPSARTLHVPALHRWQRQNREPLGRLRGILKSNAEIKLWCLNLDELPKLSSSPF